MTTMYAVVNTFAGTDNYFGTIESVHRTADAAERAAEKLQRAVKRANGRDSYLKHTYAIAEAARVLGVLPTAIVELHQRKGPGDRLRRQFVYDEGKQLNYPQEAPSEDEATILDEPF